MAIAKVAKEILIIAGDFNAKMHKPTTASEEQVLGKELWGKTAAEVAQMSDETKLNRELVIETALHNELIIANSFFRKAPEQQVTKTNLGYAQAQSPTPQSELSQCDPN